MFSRNYIFLFWVLIWFSSCQNNQEDLLTEDQPVTFAPAIANEGTHTRASNGSWEKDDRVGIYMIPHVASGSADLSTATAEATNIEYKTTSSGTSSDLIATGNYIRYPLNNSEVSFIAYYPFKSNVHDTHNHIYPVNINTQNPLTDIDLLYHNGAGTAYQRTPFKTVSLEFTHQLSKLSMTIKPVADVTIDLTDATVTLTGFPTESTFNLSTGSLGSPGNPSTLDTPIIPVIDEDASSSTQLLCETILVPHEGVAYTRVMTLTIGEDSYSYTLPATLDMEPGTAYHYDFTFTGSRIILAQNTIVSWNEVKEDHTIGKDMPDNWDQAIDWTQPIVFDGPSNCYIVPRNTQLLIPVSRAYEFAKTTYGTESGHPVIADDEVFYGKVYWQDANGVLASTDPIAPCGVGPKGYLLVKTGSTDGNAVVAVQKKVNEEYITLWSWHVWVTDYIGTTTWSNNGYTFMDRNLGATEAALSLAGRGLLYQWGRKDPFPGCKSGTAGYAALSAFKGMPDAGSTTVVKVSSSANAGAILESIKSPTTFYSSKNTTNKDWLPVRDDTMWGHGIGTAKSVYDPCPEGWRVPSFKITASTFPSADSQSPWSGVSTASWSGGADTGGLPSGLHPAAGCRDESKGGSINSGNNGYYWSASPYSSASYGVANMEFTYSSTVSLRQAYGHAYGFSVRCAKQ